MFSTDVSNIFSDFHKEAYEFVHVAFDALPLASSAFGKVRKESQYILLCFDRSYLIFT